MYVSDDADKTTIAKAMAHLKYTEFVEFADSLMSKVATYVANNSVIRADSFAVVLATWMEETIGEAERAAAEAAKEKKQ
jgi:hypothetical protein